MKGGSKSKIFIKLISLGDVEVGKSCLIKKYCEGNFVSDYITTIGIDYGVKKVSCHDAIVEINIFDFSGDDDYKVVRTPFYKNATGILMVYDVNIKSTFDNLTKWIKEAENNGLDLSNCSVVCVGNKVDIKKREVKTDTAKEWAKGKGFQFFEVSAKTGNNVQECFKYLFEAMYNKTIEFRSKYLY